MFLAIKFVIQSSRIYVYRQTHHERSESCLDLIKYLTDWTIGKIIFKNVSLLVNSNVLCN